MNARERAVPCVPDWFPNEAKEKIVSAITTAIEEAAKEAVERLRPFLEHSPLCARMESDYGEHFVEKHLPTMACTCDLAIAIKGETP